LQVFILYHLHSFPLFVSMLNSLFFADAQTNLPVCLPESCGRPNFIANANFELYGDDDFVYGSYVKYVKINVISSTVVKKP